MFVKESRDQKVKTRLIFFAMSKEETLMTATLLTSVH